jgi:hypothetical protein
MHADFSAIAAFHHRMLLDDILPWWLRHAIDREHGGRKPLNPGAIRLKMMEITL